MKRFRERGSSVLILLATAGAGWWLHDVVQLTSAIAHGESPQEAMVFDEITVKRINIVDESGKRRIVLSNADRFPNPVLKGKEYPRSVKPAGLVFYKSDGDEAGGIALAEIPGAQKNFLAFDYSNSEAVGIGMTELKGGGYSSGITLLDRVPLEADIEKVGSVGKERISISNDSGNAELSLNDADGKPRIRLFVDKQGNARMEIKDASGKVEFTAPTP